LSHVTKTARAEQDLAEIWFYVALDNVGAADALLDEFENSCRLLSTQPKMARAREELASDPLTPGLEGLRSVTASEEPFTEQDRYTSMGGNHNHRMAIFGSMSKNLELLVDRSVYSL
jgi:plasmid stabilization system protein ParE